MKRGKTPPPGFRPATDVDPVTGKQQGWLPVGDGPEDEYHRQAFKGQPDGTYELVGPKIQGNPEGYPEHTLVAHKDADQYPDFPRTFEAIKERLYAEKIEGVVWHHPDGRMVKIKRKDFWR